MIAGDVERAVVTGVAGFVGSHLADALLARGARVIGIDGFTDTYPAASKEANLGTLLAAPGFTLVRGDLHDLPLEGYLADATHVFHCAARAGVRTSWGADFERYVRDNVLVTQRLLEAARNARLARFVYMSSSSVYGEAVELPVREDAPLHPISPYGATKLSGEHLGRIYLDAFGVPFVSLRLFTVYGPRQRPDMAFHKFLRATYDGRSIDLYGDGSATRDFTYVGDAVAAIVAAGTAQGAVGEAINVAGGSRVTLRAALDALAEATGKTPIVRALPRGTGEAQHTFASIEKAQRLLGYRPAVRLTEGLRKEADWIRSLVETARIER